MDSFFLLFDVTMDISYDKFISGKFRHTHHANLPQFTTVKVSRVTASHISTLTTRFFKELNVREKYTQ